MLICAQHWALNSHIEEEVIIQAAEKGARLLGAHKDHPEDQ